MYVCECARGKGVRGDYETHPQPELLVCFHGEVESAFKKRLHPVIKDGGHFARHDGDDDGDDGPFSPSRLISIAMGERGFGKREGD